MISFIKNIKKDYYSFNPFFSLQVLLLWLFFRVLGFFGVVWKIRICCALFVFLLFTVFWEFFLFYILNSVIFQLLLFLFYYICNWLSVKQKNPMYLVFFLSFFLSLLFGKIKIIENDSLKLFIPCLDIFYCLIIGFTFLKRFNEIIIFSNMEKKYLFELEKEKLFLWSDVIRHMNVFFGGKVLIKNSIGFLSLEKIHLKEYPINSIFLSSIGRLKNNTENSVSTIDGGFKLKLKQHVFILIGLRFMRLENETFYRRSLYGLLLSFLALFIFFNSA